MVFWHATSSMVDYNMVTAWLDKTWPNIPRTDAQNFCNAVFEVQRLRELSTATAHV